MNKKKIIFNWKMFGSIEFIDFFLSIIKEKNNYDFIVCPPYLVIPEFQNKLNKLINNKNIFIGSQDCSVIDNESSNYENCTGEISASLLKNFNIKYSIIGHSERRRYFNEDQLFIISKLEHLIKYNINPIVCVMKFFDDQFLIKEIINKTISFKENIEEIFIAYEPIGSIGTGIAENIYSIEENINSIKEVINQKKTFGLNYLDQKIKIIYGGSVSSENIKEILSICDGVLIGKAGISKDKLNELILKI